MNKSRLVLSLMLMLTGACSPNGPAPQRLMPGWHLYSNNKYGYQIEYPDGYDLWETGTEQERDGAMIRIGLHEYEAPTPVLDVEVEPRRPLEKFPTLGTQIKDRSVSIEDIVLSGLQAREADYRWTATGELEFAEIYLNGVIFRFTALSGMPDFHETEWWTIISTFRLMNK